MITTAPSRPTAARVGWIDGARGACVLAVVLFHVIAWHLADLAVAPGAARIWDPVTSYLGSLRMPLLLAVSGMLASDRIRAGFRRGGLLRRTVSTGYLYVVWTAIYLTVYVLLDEPTLPHAPQDRGDAFLGLVLPQTPLWYILALTVLVPVLGALRRLPAPAVVAGLAALSVALQVVDLDAGSAGKIPQLAVYFALGVHGKDLLLRWVEPLRVRTLLMAVVAAAVSVGLGPLTVGDVDAAVLGLVRGAAFLVLGLLLVRWASELRIVRHPLEWMGQRTLQVYVLHAVLLLCLMVVLDRSGTTLPAALAAHTPTALAYPLLLTAALVGCSLGLHRLALAARSQFLFSAPPRLLAMLPVPRR